MPRALVAAALAAALVALPGPGGGAPAGRARAFDYHQVKRWWQYEPKLWRHGWRQHRKLVRAHRKWHRNHENAGKKRDRSFHDELVKRHRKLHYHAAISKENGDATWYNANGSTGACGDELRGLYAAHRTLPCGSLVSVRANGTYVFVRIKDRGPYGEGRIIDLSRKAFKKLAPPSVGVLEVKTVRLKK